MLTVNKWKEHRRTPVLPAISLFAGAGGLDLGLERAGFRIAVAVERDPVRCKTLSVNRPDVRVLSGDIIDYSSRDLLGAANVRRGEVAAVVGGPPCQPFSKSAFWVPGRREAILDDPRAQMLKEFVRIVQEVRPRAFLMENVFGLAYDTGRSALDGLVGSLTKENYRIIWRVLNAVKYGVPQKRERLFVVGVRSDTPFRFPDPTNGPPGSLSTTIGLKPYATAGDAIADFDDGIVREDEKVRGRWGHLLEVIPPGENYLYLTAHRGYPDPVFEWRTRFWSFLLKLSPDMPSWTIQANPGPYIGPFHWRNRRLRIKEIARLQTFPDDWFFEGDRRSQWAQVGDAVPPLVAQRLGESLISQVFRKQVKAVVPESRRKASRQVTLPHN